MIFQSGTAFAASQVTSIQTQITALQALNMPLNVAYAARIDAVSDLTTLADLKTLTAPNVSVCIAQDMQGKGWELWNAHAYSITHVGAVLGSMAVASVAEDISNPENFNFSDGVELERIGFANGDYYYTDVTDNTKALLDDRGYLFLIKYTELAGSYSNSSRTAVNVTSDYAYIENGRTIDKAIRNLNSVYTPKFSAKIILNKDGTIRDEDLVYYKTIGETALDQMIRDEELSAKVIEIDSTQNLLTTGTLSITAKLVPAAIAKEIEINIGYTVKI
jgi:hypothetical protein